MHGAAQALSGLADEGYKQRLIDTVAVQWTAASPIEARVWVEKLEPSVRNGAATALVETLLQREPARAASWALELAGGASGEIVEKTLTAWVARDADAALNWASEQPEAAGRAQRMALASERFRLQDAPAAERWLAAHQQH